MSNQVTLFENGALTIPAYLKREVDESTRSLMGNFDGKRISLEGGVFRMLVGGKEVAKVDDRSMNMIIVRNAATNNRSFYKNGYVPGQKATAPDCWSDDAVSPSDRVKEPQSTACATCPQNIKGSGANGESRACRYFRRTAVMLDNDIGGDIYALTLSSQSIFGDDPAKMGFQQFARYLVGFGLNVNAVVAKLKFDTDVGTPKLMFTPVRPLTEAEYDKVLAAVEHPDTLKAISQNPAEIDGAVVPEKPEIKYDTQVEQPAKPVEQPKPAAPVAAKPALQPKQALQPKPTGFAVQKTAEVIPEPTVRPSATVAEIVAPATDMNVADILADWSDTDD